MAVICLNQKDLLVSAQSTGSDSFFSSLLFHVGFNPPQLCSPELDEWQSLEYSINEPCKGADQTYVEKCIYIRLSGRGGSLFFLCCIFIFWKWVEREDAIRCKAKKEEKCWLFLIRATFKHKIGKVIISRAKSTASSFATSSSTLVHAYECDLRKLECTYCIFYSLCISYLLVRTKILGSGIFCMAGLLIFFFIQLRHLFSPSQYVSVVTLRPLS